jgi:hypothetical protein
MSTRTLGILASVVGSAVGAWWLARQRSLRRPGLPTERGRDHGTVIFHNTPTPVEGDVL